MISVSGSQGRFIVIDGGEGAGKTTLLRALQECLPESEFVFTREPGGTAVATEIRRILLDRTQPLSLLAEFFLFWAARAEHLAQIIVPALFEGKTVISDRFDSSTFAYQIRGRENVSLLPHFDLIREMCCRNVSPLYIFLDIDPEEGLRRTEGRRENNHFDAESLAFHTRVRSGFMEFFASHPHRIVSAHKPPEIVLGEVLEIIRESV